MQNDARELRRQGLREAIEAWKAQQPIAAEVSYSDIMAGTQSVQNKTAANATEGEQPLADDQIIYPDPGNCGEIQKCQKSPTQAEADIAPGMPETPEGTTIQ